MNVLLACEESQAVCIEFRKLGHDAYSCDIQPCSGGHPEWHLQMDVFEAISLKKWDMMIAFPPCTHLAVSGARWFYKKQKEQADALDFVRKLMQAPIFYKGIENPVSVISSHIRKPDQIIQPYQFGHGEVKTTCLWLYNLPKLIPTNIVDGREQKVWRMPPSENRAKLRSKTYPGIAKAMAAQWGNLSVLC